MNNTGKVNWKRHAASLLLGLLCSVGLISEMAYAQAAIPVYRYFVKNTYPHDPQAFTQGLLFKDGHLYESTGQNGQSSLRKVDLSSGRVVQRTMLDKDVFGEGITDVGNDIIGLTWTSQVGYVFDQKTFKLKRKFHYPGEGWGLASDRDSVYMSDGSAFIRVLDPHTLAEVRRVEVKAEGKPIASLNELEMVDGQLFANIWGADVIARIDPASGAVVGWIDLTGLLPPGQRGTDNPDAVLNGIAWDSRGKRLFVTGKLWPKLFEIELIEVQRH
ncbi:glutaminyl-peptide cyclotransferase [Janthinobacterium agaricidamnosum]|uniref:Glutamine cyclotransferase n=1 Tax=Janthinobacterium agaricidamnosum NBRC 102515 = DSM 9628 TaxID=1349767 RepID=W0VEV2_9BURK|nr:glutaminyl-peptide cyclotransferase [Janthinobacterium agaricidamnosum]CDG85877.1 glutamine cyclotransferase [Janthinobacterium agaricidamnosum NBRC 102515 = DSM 9628]